MSNIPDELITTARELFETAERARARRSELAEYIVSVGQTPIKHAA
jgi:hypothetical protein